MFDTSSDPRKVAITCRFIQHDQWLQTHIQPSWTVRQLKLWLVHRLFGISIPARTFNTVSFTGQPTERPPSPITFAPDPRTRPASPIIFATPHKSGLYGSVAGGPTGKVGTSGGGDGGSSGGGGVRGIFSDTDEDLLSGSESGFSSTGKGKGKGKSWQQQVRIETGPPTAGPSRIPGGRIGPSSHSISDTESGASGVQVHGHTVVSPTTTSGYSPPEADRFPGGVDPHHWTVTRYSTGQILADEEVVSWYDIIENEILELHGLSFPSTHTLYEYQVCHLWNPERHRERERLRKKLKKRFEAEAAANAKNYKDKDGDSGAGWARRAAIQAQILRAMNLNSGAGANVGVVEYYGSKLATTQVELTLTRLPRSIDLYIQPYWEGWVRTLRIVWRGDWSDIVFNSATSGHPIPVQFHSAAGTSGGVGGGSLYEPYKYGIGMGGPTVPGSGAATTAVYHGNSGHYGGLTGERAQHGRGSSSSRIVRVEWRERWVRIHNGILIVLKDRQDEDATHVLPLKNVISLNNTQHLVRYLSYTGFNPPLDHPAVTPDILVPAINVPIQRPLHPTHHHSDSYPYSNNRNSKSKRSSYNHAYPDSDDSEPPGHHRHHHSHDNSGSGSHGHHSSLGGGKECNFLFPSYSHLTKHMKAREVTPLVGSRFDPTYLPITIEEQKASGLRVVCLQFRKTVSGGGSGLAATNSSSAGARPSTSNYPDDRDLDFDPTTLVLEDMKERAGDWGGIRSGNILWKCPPKLRREPLYILRARLKMSKMRAARTSRSGTYSSNVANPGRSSRGQRSSGRHSTLLGLGDLSHYDYGHHRGTPIHKHSSLTAGAQKDRYYERERQRHQHHRRTRETDKNEDLQAILATQIFGALPISNAEEKIIRERKERKKREKEIEKERARQEKELRGKGKMTDKGKGKEEDIAGGNKEEKENDWGLGSLNVAFWNWGKKKKGKKGTHIQQRNEEVARHTSENSFSTPTFAYPSTSTVQLPPQGLGSTGHYCNKSASASTMTIGTSTNTAASSTGLSGTTSQSGDGSTTVVSERMGSTSAMALGSVDGTGAKSSEDEGSDDDGDTQIEFAPGMRSETSTSNTSEEEDEEEDDDEDDDVEDPEFDGTYPAAVSEAQPVQEEEAECEQTECVDHLLNPSQPGSQVGASQSSSRDLDPKDKTGTSNIALQVVVDNLVECEPQNTPREIPSFTGFALSQPSAKAISIDTNVGTSPRGYTSHREPHEHAVTRKPSRRLVGQLHSSDEEYGEDHGGENVIDEGELSSPVFAPPPRSRKPFMIRSPTPLSMEYGSLSSSQGSDMPFSRERMGVEDEGCDFDDDLEFDIDLLGPRRAGYRYGLYDTKRDEARRRKAEQIKEMEEQREKEVARLKELEEQEIEKEKREREQETEKEKERREKKRREEEGEWVCLDIGNDFAFQSFLRIVHQHCPHPVKSTFMDRTLGGPLDDMIQLPPNSRRTTVPSEATSNSVRPRSPSAQSHHSASRSLVEAPPCIETILGAQGVSTHLTNPASPTSFNSHETTSSQASATSLTQRTSDPVSSVTTSVPVTPMPSRRETHSPSPSKEVETEPDEPIDSEAEYVAPLPGYGHPRFMYPSRTFATPPYPEWRINTMRKAQIAGMGDIGKAMEFIHWGDEDPVIAGASGALNDLESMERRWGSRSSVPGSSSRVTKDLKEKRRESGLSDNVSNLGTIGPRTVSSGRTSALSPTKRGRRPSYRGRNLRRPRSAGSAGPLIPEVEREGGSSGNESSGEDSDGSIDRHTSGSDGEKPAKFARMTAIPSPTNRLSKWSDEEEEYISELEWTAWHLDIRRHAKRQYAIQARREANLMNGMTGELDLGVPVNPADDITRNLKGRYAMEPRARIAQGLKPPDETSSASISLSNSIYGSRSVGPSSGAVTSVAGATPPHYMESDAPGPDHVQTSSQQLYPTLHHSTSLATGLRKGMLDAPTRRPSMPILITHAEKEKEKDKGKGKERSFWNLTGFSGNDDLKSPTTASSNWFSRKDGKEKEWMSPGGTASQPVSASGSVGRSGSALLKGGLLRKRESGDTSRDREKDGDKEKERAKLNEGEKEINKSQRPQLWVATSSAVASSPMAIERSKSPDPVRSPTFAPGRLVRRMRSDASILSVRTGDTVPELSSSPRQKKKKGPMGKLLDSSIDFVDGL